MAFSLVGFATDLVSNLGYGGLAGGLLLDSFGVPIPSEVLIPLAVVGGRHGHDRLWLVVVVAVTAQLAGAVVSWSVGRHLGTAAVRRYGRYLLISAGDVDRAERAFARHGRWIVGVGRALPVVRGFIGYPAGAAGMPLAPFVVWTAAGTGVWTGVLVGLGELWRTHLATISHVMDDAAYGIAALLIALVALHVRRALRLARRRPAP